jgi:drug/metabolite transporter (DMT)-like permease
VTTSTQPTSSSSGAQAAPLASRLPTTDLAMIAVVLIWGANFSVVKLALQEIPPLAFAGLRFAVAAVLLWVIARWREGSAPLPPGSLWKLTWIGLVGNTLYQLCFIYGLSITTAANASLLIATTPAMVALAGAVLGVERLKASTIAGIALAFCGVVLVLLSRGLAFAREGLLGDMLLIASAVCWTAYTLGVRMVGAGISPLRITSTTMLTGTPGLLLVGLPELLGVRWAAVSGGAWLGLGYSALLALVLAYVVWNNSVRVAGSNRTAIYGCVIPLVATLVAWPLLGEQPTALQGLGAALIIAGVLLTRR